MSDEVMQVPDTQIYGVDVYLDVSHVAPEAQENFVALVSRSLQSYRDNYEETSRERGELFIENMRLRCLSR